MKLKSIARSLVGDRVAGVFDYYRFPKKASAWGGPFNGQERRQELFLTIVRKCRPAAIVETGTYLGTTTDFMAGAGIPVFSVEGHARHYGFALARLWWRRNVTLRRGDSRRVLRSFFDGPLRSLCGQTIFAYLDAHWDADLPLAEELEIVFGHCRSAVAMVDDFQVPGDADYQYDDYGPGKALTSEYIRPAVLEHSLAVFYPAVPAAMDSGLHRGCVVLARDDIHGAALDSIALLRRHPAADLSAC